MPAVHDVTYENAQARERTQMLDGPGQSATAAWSSAPGTSPSWRSAGRPTTATTCPCTRSTPPCPKPWCATWSTMPPSSPAARSAEVLRRHPGHPGQPRAAARRRGRRDRRRRPRKPGRPVRAARLLPLSHASLWFPSVKDLPDGAAHLFGALMTPPPSINGYTLSTGASLRSSLSGPACRTAPRSARSRSLLAATGGCPATPAHACGWKSWKPFPLNRKIFVGGSLHEKSSNHGLKDNAG